MIQRGYGRWSGCKSRKGTEGRRWERRHRERRVNKARDALAVNIIGTETNYPLAYDMGLEHHRLYMSKLGWNGGKLERHRDQLFQDICFSLIV